MENDGVIIFIDMLLHKPQVYRHLLLNTSNFLQVEGLGKFRTKISAKVIKMAAAFLLFEAYHLWETMIPDATLSWQSYAKIVSLAALGKLSINQLLSVSL